MSNHFDRKQIRELLPTWSSTFGFANATGVFDNWTQQSFANTFMSLIEYDSTLRNLFDSFIREIQPFDCLQIGGVQLTENQQSDVIAALFDQNWGHSFARPILKYVLAALSRKGSLSKAICDLIKDLNESLVLDQRMIFVRRENRGASSRSDIDVYAPGPDGFLMRIEHKIRGGWETVISGKHQTQRLLEDAIDRAMKLGIDRRKVIAIFLTPDGASAANPEFALLSFREFSDAVRAAIIDTSDTSQISAAAASILGFMTFYGRM